MIRILSDLHLFDARTQVRDLRQLEPLLSGVRTLVLNGDSCEMRRGVTAEQLASLRDFFRQRVPEVVYVTGNHDPDISETHEILLGNGRLWVTHGDVFFDDLTPWSRHVAQIRTLVAAKRARSTGDYRQLAERLRIAREVAREETDLPDRSTRTWTAHLAWAWQTFFPPRQPLAMLRCWRDLPVHATALALAQRPTAQVVVTGHVHFPGVWRLGQGPTIVNTGSFFRPLGGNLVDVFDDHVEVHRIDHANGTFRPGRLLTTIPLRA
jgi:predicted phosphodiesterase